MVLAYINNNQGRSDKAAIFTFANQSWTPKVAGRGHEVRELHHRPREEHSSRASKARHSREGKDRNRCVVVLPAHFLVVFTASAKVFRCVLSASKAELVGHACTVVLSRGS